jgi:hypothetical protein
LGRRERWATTGVCEENDELRKNTVELNTYRYYILLYYTVIGEDSNEL